MATTTILMPECCRCCLVEENDIIYVFDILDEFDSKICDLIETCGGVAITEDDIYSKNICGNCLNDLANAARFRERCLSTALILQNTTIETKHELHLLNEDDDEPKDDSQVPEDDFIEEIIFEQIGDVDAEDELAFSEIQDTNEVNQSDIQYIIAEEPTESELRDFDYDNLISEPNDFDDEQVDTICLQGLDQHLEGVVEASIVKPVQKEICIAQPRPIQLNFVCQHCGAGFAMQKNLARHLVMHQNYVCDICSVVFYSKKDLADHRLSHAEDEPTGQSDLYPEPIEKLLNPKKNHRCTYCDKAFVSSSALVAHVRVHTQERPFPCSYCPKRFRTAGAQELHERRHNGVKPYKCDLCGKGFAESSNLKVHRRTHTQEKPHVCTVCKKAFARVFLLQIHQRTHTGDRPFSCGDCGKSFSQQGDLAAHRRIHTGERPHRCDICGKGFIKSSGLTQHRKKHEQSSEDIRIMLVDAPNVLPATESIIKEEEVILESYDLVQGSQIDPEEGVDELMI